MRRLAALAYDSLLLVAVWFVATALILPLNQGEAFRPDHWGYLAYLAGVCYLFFAWFWTHGGQTLGMKAWGLRLRTMNGNPFGWRRAALRFAGAFVSLMCFGAGYWWSLIDPRGRAWHDHWSGSELVRE